MNAFTRIAEDRIRRAIEENVFKDLENEGKPLRFEDETWVPEDLRMAYRVLKNAGHIPPELELKKEIMNLRSLVETIDDDAERLKKLAELNYKLLCFNMMRKKPLDLEAREYEEKVEDRLLGGGL
jgi:hypothetical protein